MLILIAFLILSVANSQIWIERNVPTAIVGKPVKIAEEIISGQDTQIDYSILLPPNWSMNWTLTGGNYSFEERGGSYKGKFYHIYHFTFNATEDQKFNLEYTIVPEEVGEYEIAIIWFTPSSFGEDRYSLVVTTEKGAVPIKAVCGNNICETGLGENRYNCPSDCPFETHEEYYVILLTFATYISIFGLIYQMYKYKSRKGAVSKIKREKVVKKKEKKVKKGVKRKKAKKSTQNYEKVLKKLAAIKRKLK